MIKPINYLSIHNQLRKELVREGFAIEKREYKPRLILGREIILNQQFNQAEFCQSIPAMKAEIGKISLMKSERIKGKLIYQASSSATGYLNKIDIYTASNPIDNDLTLQDSNGYVSIGNLKIIKANDGAKILTSGTIKVNKEIWGKGFSLINGRR